jgi:hypothetical protein
MVKPNKSLICHGIGRPNRVKKRHEWGQNCRHEFGRGRVRFMFLSGTGRPGRHGTAISDCFPTQFGRWRRARGQKNARWPVSRVLSRPSRGGDDHSSGTPVARRLARPTRAAVRKPTCRPFGRRAAPIWSCSGWGLPCRSRYRERGALLPHRFTLTGRPKRTGGLVLCCTVPGVAPAGRYPAPSSPWSPDFPRPLRTAVIRPSGPL